MSRPSPNGAFPLARLLVWAVLSIVGSGVLAWLWAVGAPGARGAPAAPIAVAIGQSTMAAGEGYADGAHWVVEGAQRDGSAIVAFPSLNVAADQYPFFEYRIDGLSGNLEAMLIWHDADGELHQALLPTPDGGMQTFRLAGLPGWSGATNTFAVAVFPVSQLAPARAEIPSFRVRAARFVGPSTWHSLKARASAWFAVHPWTFRSVNYLGGTSDHFRESWAPRWLAASALLTVLLAWLLFRGNFRPYAFAGVLIMWMIADGLWARTLWRQQAATAELYGGLEWPEHLEHMADSGLFEFAEKIKAAAAELDGKVAVLGPSHYFEQRMTWHLSPINAARLEEPLDVEQLQVGDWIVHLTGPGAPAVRFGEGQLRIADARPLRALRKVETVHGAAYELVAEQVRP